jgi:predicted phosphoribosyltransferase
MVCETFEIAAVKKRFSNRREAGKCLAENLSIYVNRDDVVALALPRGGVPVAAEVAKRLKVPLDVFVVRKLHFPDHLKLTVGAIATGGVRLTDRDVVEAWQIPELVIDAVAAKEQEELTRLERIYRGDLPPQELQGKTVILVDDGIATGSTVVAAVAALRQVPAARIIVGVPVIAGSSYCRIRQAADDVAAIIVPEEFHNVSEWYEDFSLTSDDEVHRLLAEAAQRLLANSKHESQAPKNRSVYDVAQLKAKSQIAASRPS